jgi:hypothetical protein
MLGGSAMAAKTFTLPNKTKEGHQDHKNKSTRSHSRVDDELQSIKSR